MASRIVIVTELFHPETTSTGHFLTGIAEYLAAEQEVLVICTQPTYSARGQLAPTRETRNGVQIERCWSTRLDKDFLPFRLVNAVSVAGSLGLRALLRAQRGDTVLVVTTPPLLPFKAWSAARLKGARLVLLVHDVYPDVLAAAGILGRGGAAMRLLDGMTHWLYDRVDRIIVIGRDMQALITHRQPALARKVVMIPNWADTKEIAPAIRESANAFVVQYSGNMGRTHNLRALIEAAELLRDDETVRFVIAGSGAKRSWVERAVAERRLSNVVVERPVAREALGAHLAAADLCVISLEAGMYGVSVPSRLYNIMAAGKPVLAIVDRDSEVWRVVDEEKIGWAIDAASSPERIAEAIRQAAADREGTRAAGMRAREAAADKYSEARVLPRFAEALASLSG